MKVVITYDNGRVDVFDDGRFTAAQPFGSNAMLANYELRFDRLGQTGDVYKRQVLDRAWSAEEGISVDLVARDGDAIVFIDVAAREGIDKGLPEEDPVGCRQRMEIAAARWLAEHAEELADVTVRFDLIALMVIDEKRALLRHHVNALGCGEFADSAD